MLTIVSTELMPELDILKKGEDLSLIHISFGRWASTHIHSRAGAQFATLLLGVMIFVDDYFNCLTVGAAVESIR